MSKQVANVFSDFLMDTFEDAAQYHEANDYFICACDGEYSVDDLYTVWKHQQARIDALEGKGWHKTIDRYEEKIKELEAERGQLREKADRHHERWVSSEDECHEVKRERADLERQVIELREQNAALMAHVERLRKALGPKILDWIDCGMAANGRHKDSWALELRNELRQALLDKPTTSLARVRADAAADHIGRWADTILQAITNAEEKHLEDRNYPAICFDMIAELTVDMKEDAKRIRKQAEGE